LETASGYGELLHGEAVSIGMCLAAQLSTRLGLAAERDAQRLAVLLQRFDLPVTSPRPQASAALLDLMRLDKKALSGKLRLILWRGIGKAEIHSDAPDAAILDLLS
jgi:3-dehydroquinate synthase